MNGDSPDVLVVGADACGCLVANKLAKAGLSGTLLEAGKRLDSATDLRNNEAHGAKTTLS
jgi:choline dehydrogenase-like flavoprotein